MTKITVDTEFRIEIPLALRASFPAGCVVTIQKSDDGCLLISRPKHSLATLQAATPSDSIIPEWEKMVPVGNESK